MSSPTGRPSSDSNSPELQLKKAFYISPLVWVLMLVFLIVDGLVLQDELAYVTSPKNVHVARVVDTPQAYPRGVLRVRPLLQLEGQQLPLDAVMKPEDAPRVGWTLEVLCTETLQCRPAGFWYQYGHLVTWVLPIHLLLLGLLIWYLRFGAYKQVYTTRE